LLTHGKTHELDLYQGDCEALPMGARGTRWEKLVE